MDYQFWNYPRGNKQQLNKNVRDKSLNMFLQANKQENKK